MATIFARLGETVPEILDLNWKSKLAEALSHSGKGFPQRFFA